MFGLHLLNLIRAFKGDQLKPNLIIIRGGTAGVSEQQSLFFGRNDDATN